MNIEKVIVYRFNGTDYPTFAKAKDAAEDRVSKFVTKLMIGLGHSANEAFKLSVLLIDNKAELAKLLDYPTDEETDA